MNVGIGDSRLVLRRQRRVRIAAALITLGLLVQAQSFLSTGMAYFLGFGVLGVPLVIAGVGLAALAMFTPTRAAEGEETREHPEPVEEPRGSAGPT